MKEATLRRVLCALQVHQTIAVRHESWSWVRVMRVETAHRGRSINSSRRSIPSLRGGQACAMMPPKSKRKLTQRRRAMTLVLANKPPVLLGLPLQPWEGRRTPLQGPSRQVNAFESSSEVRLAVRLYEPASYADGNAEGRRNLFDCPVCSTRAKG